MFKEELIPTGAVAEIDAVTAATMPLDKLLNLQAQNEYAKDLVQEAWQKRIDRQANGFVDKPPTPRSSKVASNGKMEIDFAKVLNLFGETKVKTKRFLPVWGDSSRRNLQASED